jgi:hypothetical protein
VSQPPVPEVIELGDAEPLIGARLRASVDRIRLAAKLNLYVKFTPDAALAVAELIEKLAGAAGIELPEDRP